MNATVFVSPVTGTLRLTVHPMYAQSRYVYTSSSPARTSSRPVAYLPFNGNVAKIDDLRIYT